MAEEFQQLPIGLQTMSTKLVDNRNSRTALICGVIVLMSFASSLSLVINTDSTTTNTLNDTTIISPILASMALKAKNESQKRLFDDEDVIINMSLTATVYHKLKSDNKNDSFRVEYNCTGNCIKDTVGLRKLVGSSFRNGRDYQNFSAIGVITSTYDDCPHPEYIVFTWVLCMVALATALKLYYLIKLFLAIVMVAVYSILILLGYNAVFTGDYINSDE